MLILAKNVAPAFVINVKKMQVITAFYAEIK